MMKISKTISDKYFEHKEYAEQIQKNIEPSLKLLCEQEGWFFISRIKKEESYAQKLECSYVGLNVDDLYACSIVVTNKAKVESAVSKLKKLPCIVFQKQKPENLYKTRVQPDVFRFDAVRLYFSTRPSSRGKQPFDDEVFEVQVKTFLEYVWGMVSHDLDYKSQKYSWSVGKVCSQIKAILDSAELALSEAELLSKSKVVSIENDDYVEKQKYIDLFKSWQGIDLPEDLKRLTDNVQLLVKVFDLDVDSLNLLLSKHNVLSSVSLSPFYMIVKGLLLEYKENFFIAIQNYNKKHKKHPIRIKVLNELNLEDIIRDIDLTKYDFVSLI